MEIVAFWAYKNHRSAAVRGGGRRVRPPPGSASDFILKIFENFILKKASFCVGYITCDRVLDIHVHSRMLRKMTELIMLSVFNY